MEYSQQIWFGYDGSRVIVDKYDNAQKWSKEYIFTDKIEPILSNTVATIGKKDTVPKGIGTVSWYWNDDEGQLHKKKPNNVF